MSVKSEYETLLQRKVMLCAEIEIAKDKFAVKEQEWQRLGKKKRQLLERSSELAKRLLEEVEQQTSKVEDEKKKIQETIQKLEEELESVQKRVKELEDNPQEYVEEQAKNMAKQLKEYVGEHEEELGIAFTSVMTIKAQKEEVPDSYGAYWIPTGNVLIADKTKNTIAESNEFYMTEELYEFKRDDWYNNVSIYRTEWFSRYLKLFYQVLRREIEEAFENHPNFKVKFTDDTHFTIELR